MVLYTFEIQILSTRPYGFFVLSPDFNICLPNLAVLLKAIRVFF